MNATSKDEKNDDDGLYVKFLLIALATLKRGFDQLVDIAFDVNILQVCLIAFVVAEADLDKGIADEAFTYSIY